MKCPEAEFVESFQAKFLLDAWIIFQSILGGF